MWARHLLFWSISLVGLAAAAGLVFPRPRDHAHHPLAPGSRAEIAASIERVDRLLRASWDAAGIIPSGAADDLTVARRLSLALTGTIPSLEEIRQFEARPAAERVDWWLARLLADRRYADYVAERLARAYVGVDDGPFLLFRRRRFVSWLADELSDNTSYDELVRRMIADTGIWTDTPSINFITIAVQPDSDEDPDPNRLAARVSRAFLGVRLDCAECHDHPFAPWKQRDFQRLAAFFSQTKRKLAIRDADGEYLAEDQQAGTKTRIAPAVPFQPELLPRRGTRRERLAGWVTHPGNRSLARATANRAWALVFGRGLVEPIDNVGEGEDPTGVLDALADDFSEHHYDWRRLLRVIASTRAFRLESRARSDAAGGELTDAHRERWAAFPLGRLRPEQVSGALLQAASLSTIDAQSHVVVRLFRHLREREFIERYGDAGSEEFEPRAGTIPQRLLMMNGSLVQERIGEGPLASACAQIAALAPSDDAAVETALLATLSRRPTPHERLHFATRLQGTTGQERSARLADLYWTLLNSTEFSWNH